MSKENHTISSKIDSLSDTIRVIDSLSQEGFSEISSIARLALAALETPDGYLNPEIIAQALRAIFGKAIDIKNSINCEAEGVGCHYVDDSLRRRNAAQRAVEKSRSKSVSEVPT